MEDDATILPWKTDTRQVQGRNTERRLIKESGGVVHPSSGSGPIKDDGHTDETLIEVKDAIHVHRIIADDLLALYQRGIRQRLIPTYVVRFANGLILEGTIRADTGMYLMETPTAPATTPTSRKKQKGSK